MKTNQSDDNVPRAYIKEKWKNRELPKASYAPPPISMKEIEGRMGKRDFFIMCRRIDTTSGMPK